MNLSRNKCLGGTLSTDPGKLQKLGTLAMSFKMQLVFFCLLRSGTLFSSEW